MNAKQIEAIKFAQGFTKALGKFVKAQKAEAKKQGLTVDKTRAVMALAFSILGKNQKAFMQRAGLK